MFSVAAGDLCEIIATGLRHAQSGRLMHGICGDFGSLSYSRLHGTCVESFLLAPTGARCHLNLHGTCARSHYWPRKRNHSKARSGGCASTFITPFTSRTSSKTTCSVFNLHVDSDIFQAYHTLYAYTMNACINVQDSPNPQPHRPKKASDWIPYKDTISDLYASHELKQVMEIISDRYNFSPTYVKDHPLYAVFSN